MARKNMAYNPPFVCVPTIRNARERELSTALFENHDDVFAAMEYTMVNYAMQCPAGSRFHFLKDADKVMRFAFPLFFFIYNIITVIIISIICEIIF